jgi:hypothetical protein
MAKKKEFPKEIFVQWSDEAGEGDGSLEYLLANSTEAEAVNFERGGHRVGVYKLVETVRIIDQTVPKFVRRKLRA